MRTGLQQMHAPSVGATMLDRFKKRAVRRGRIDTGEHPLAALKDLVMQARFNRRQIDDAVDDARQLGGRGVHIARAGVHAHEVAQELRRLRVALQVGLRRPVRS